MKHLVILLLPQNVCLLAATGITQTAPTSANSDPHSNQENCTPPKHNKELPSVSPLVKKYNSRDSELSESSKNSRESMWGVRDFEEVLAGSGRSDEGERDD